MTINYSNLLEFIGEDLKSYVILRKVVGYDNFMIRIMRICLQRKMWFSKEEQTTRVTALSFIVRTCQ